MTDFDKPSRAEDEYFAKQEVERRKKWAQEQAQKLQTGEKERLKQLHYMKCPKDGMDLATIEFQGISIDQCATCGGVWFDAGEVDQLRGKDTGVVSKVLSIFR